MKPSSTTKLLSVFAVCQILFAAIPSMQAQPALPTVTNQAVFEDQPTELTLLRLSDTNTTLDQIQLSAASSNPQLVPVTNIFFYAYFNNTPVSQGLLGMQRYMSLTPVFGQTGTSTITVVASDGVGSATNSFVFTVNPPSPGSVRFANTNIITIPTQSMATPYPSQIVVSNASSAITNLTVTLSQFNHAYPGDVDMLLVAPDNQTAVVIYSRVGDGPGSSGAATNITTTLRDNAIFALPYPYPLISTPFLPANYSSATNGGPAIFPTPAPDPSFYTNRPVAMSSFNGISPNGTWSLYVYGYTNYLNTNSSSIAAWSLMIASVPRPIISGLTNQSTPVNTQTAALPFNVYEAQTPASNLVLTVSSSNPSVMTTNDIVFGGSDTNRTITLTPEPNITGTTTISVIVTDGGGMGATNSFLMTVNTGQLTATGITASDKIYDGTTNAAVNASAAILTGQGLTGSGVTLNSNGVSGAFANRNVGSNETVQIAGLTLNGSNAGNYILAQPTTTASITKADATITVTPYNVTYDGSAHTAVGTANGVLNENLSGLDLSGTTHEVAGSYISDGWTFTDVTGNYNNTNGVVGDAIGAPTLTATANNALRGYGQTNPVFTVSYSGFVNGEGTNVLSGALALTTGAVTNSPVGGYVITNMVGNLVATNYVLSLSNGTLTVTGAVLTATANNALRGYGQTNPVFTASYSGFVNGEGTNVFSGSLALATSAVTNSPVGGYVITNTIGSLVATNYVLSLSNGILSVTRALLTATANTGIAANDKTYDGTTAATLTLTNLILTGVVSGDTVNLSTNDYSANFTNVNVGTNIPVSVSGLTLSGASATNYTLAPLAGLTANIIPVTLTVSADNKTKTFGLPNPLLTVSYGGFVNSEGTNVLAGAPGLSTSAATNSPPGPYAIVAGVGTLSATNYVFNLVNGTLTVVALPQLSGVHVNLNEITMTWPTVANQTYQLQTATNVNVAVWTPVGNPVAGTGGLISVTNGIGVLPYQFFRLEISP